MEQLADGWTAHQAPSGHTYYYNAATKTSTYQKPLRQSLLPPPTPPLPSQESPAAADPKAASSGAKLNHLATSVSERASKGPIDRRFGEDRPKYKDAISTAAPWLLVTTKLGRIFYHNPQTGDSSWQLPESIADAVEEWQRTRFDDPLMQHQPMDDESDISQEADYEPEQTETDPNEANVEFDEDDIAWQLAAMEDEGLMPAEQAAEDQQVFTATERQELFQVMLSDCEVDPYSTWEAEVEKIAADPRYLGECSPAEALSNTSAGFDEIEEGRF
ncbi:hypothetical protein BCR37DRAFT_47852 [Protomyces lactucae-debilis]|uniref:WW domain-containing protein n=1 Tax=Protomyces lactucae-debilis TaxID=2754530 RepID=A0A1Y2FE40_PROLT|nr:uncharacterized protein BCR37DRAFT_47852 [Protomyces lactucae-debilis]ORY81576.1 hypothetical protein BCR37DRAFT_47852 [Protomyces lactucae-debilis]